jgi:hypothetical protein
LVLFFINNSGLISIKRESYVLSFIYFCWNFVLPIYFVYKMLDVWLLSSHLRYIPQHSIYSARITIVLITFITVIYRLVLVVLHLVCVFNFKKGLLGVYEKENFILQF